VAKRIREDWLRKRKENGYGSEGLLQKERLLRVAGWGKRRLSDKSELGVSVLHLCSPRNQVLVQTKRYAVFVITPTMMIDSRFQVQELAGGKRLTVEGRV